MVGDLKDDYNAELRKQALKQVSTWTLAGAVALIGFAFLGWVQILRPLIAAVQCATKSLHLEAPRAQRIQ